MTCLMATMMKTNDDDMTRGWCELVGKALGFVTLRDAIYREDGFQSKCKSSFTLPLVVVFLR